VVKRVIEIAVAVLAASALLVAQQDSVNALRPSAVPDVPRLVASSLGATERHWQGRRQYSYVEHSESRRRDMEGHVKSEDVEISSTTLVNGVPFEQLVERNGEPPSAWEKWRQAKALDTLQRETPAQLATRIGEQDDDTGALVREVPKAFDFRFIGHEVIHGRDAYVLHITPRSGYEARGKYGKVLSKVEGTVWVDAEDLVWIKVDGHVIESFSIGLFLVRLLRGSLVRIEQSRVEDGVWLPLRVDVRATAKILLVKSVVIERLLTYSDYRRNAGIPANQTVQDN
jgi:hypothetical protein